MRRCRGTCCCLLWLVFKWLHPPRATVMTTTMQNDAAEETEAWRSRKE